MGYLNPWGSGPGTTSNPKQAKGTENIPKHTRNPGEQKKLYCQHPYPPKSRSFGEQASPNMPQPSTPREGPKNITTLDLASLPCPQSSDRRAPALSSLPSPGLSARWARGSKLPPTCTVHPRAAKESRAKQLAGFVLLHLPALETSAQIRRGLYVLHVSPRSVLCHWAYKPTYESDVNYPKTVQIPVH